MRVAGARHQAEAELIAGMLLEEGIPSLVQRTGGFDVPDFLASGPRVILVPSSGADAAREFLGAPRAARPAAAPHTAVDARARGPARRRGRRARRREHPRPALLKTPPGRATFSRDAPHADRRQPHRFHARPAAGGRAARGRAQPTSFVLLVPNVTHRPFADWTQAEALRSLRKAARGPTACSSRTSRASSPARTRSSRSSGRSTAGISTTSSSPRCPRSARTGCAVTSPRGCGRSACP